MVGDPSLAQFAAASQIVFSAARQRRAFSWNVFSFLAEHPREEGPEGPVTWTCQRKLTSPSPAGPPIGRVGVVKTANQYDNRGYEASTETHWLFREGPGGGEAVELVSATSDKGGSTSYRRFRWEPRDVMPGGATELLFFAQTKDSTDYGDPLGRRGQLETEEELVWVVGLDAAGQIAAFGPIPLSRKESAEPGFENGDDGSEIPSGKPWKQSWRFDVRWEGGNVIVAEPAGKPVPARDRHRLGQFAIRFQK